MTVADHDHQTLNAVSTPALAFYGKMLTFSRLQLNTNDLGAIDAQLNDTLSSKSSHIPILIDSKVEQDVSALVELLWSYGLQPIGVVTGMMDEQARKLRLAIFPADGKRIDRVVSTQNSAVDHGVSKTALAETPLAIGADEHMSNLIHDQMLRSGQSLTHVGGDLILTNSINSGAEAITDNSLHVYGRAQGRLVAGATGDKNARIFCHVFNPSLVSVAGTYCLRDNLPEHVVDKAVEVKFVEGEGLVFTVMNDG